MVKFVEAQEGNRELPIVSFIARQRNLVEVVGKMHTGAENALLHDSLSHWAGCFGEIRLEDTDLPALVEQRILRPKSTESAKGLDAAFVNLQQSAGASWNTLLATKSGRHFVSCTRSVRPWWTRWWRCPIPCSANAPPSNC